MTVAIIEFIKLLEVGRSCLEGSSTFAELYHGAKMTFAAAHFWGISSSPLMETIREWEHKTSRCWDNTEEQRFLNQNAHFDERLRQQLLFPDRDINCHATPESWAAPRRQTSGHQG